MQRVILLAAIAMLLPAATSSDASSMRRKLQLIQRDRIPAGSRVTIHQDELNAYVRSEMASVAGASVSDPRLELGNQRATGYANIDFAKLRAAQGRPLGWPMATLLGGQHTVRIDAGIRSANGKATVDLERLEVSGIPISGRALDYLIRNFLWTYYPDAKVGRPFELAHRIDRLEVKPSAVDVVIGK